MKKIVILAFFSLIGLTTMAQSLPISLGIHGGWNDTKIKAKHLKVDSHGGYMIGAFARINFGSIYLEPALNFAHKESKVTAGNIGKFKYSSIDIPVLVGYHILELPIFKLRGFVGAKSPKPARKGGTGSTRSCFTTPPCKALKRSQNARKPFFRPKPT